MALILVIASLVIAGASMGVLALPRGVKAVESEAFRGVSFLTLVIPAGVTQIGAEAFDAAEVRTVFCADPALVSGMFGPDTVIVTDPGAYYAWAGD